MRPKWSNFRALCADDSLCQIIKDEKFPTHRFNTHTESVAAGMAFPLLSFRTLPCLFHRFPFVAVSIGFAVNKQVSSHL
uniref:Uncharacterized protein n=1 Tax=Hucho hucho TaxID=62062 RepID=A0A4W5MAU9_9TELE